MKEKTDQLHERYYKKFWRLHENQAALGDSVRDVIRQNILDEYLTEYAIMRAQDDIENKRLLHELSVKGDNLIPAEKRFRLFWKKPNRAQEQIDRKALAEAEQFFERQDRAIELLAAALDRADEYPPDNVFTSDNTAESGETDAQTERQSMDKANEQTAGDQNAPDKDAATGDDATSSIISNK